MPPTEINAYQGQLENPEPPPQAGGELQLMANDIPEDDDVGARITEARDTERRARREAEFFAETDALNNQAESTPEGEPPPEEITDDQDGDTKEAPAVIEFLNWYGQKGIDLTRGVASAAIDSPWAIGTGLMAGAQNLLDATDAAADWLDENVLDLGTGIGSDDGVQIPGGEAAKEFQPDSMGGKFIKGMTQFVLGFVGAGKVKGLKQAADAGFWAKAGNAMLRGAAADSLFFDPMEGNLSNWINENPDLENPITEFLATDEENTEVGNRLRNALEGTILGVPVDAAMWGLRAYKMGMRAKRAAEDQARSPVDSADDFPTMDRRELDAVLDNEQVFPVPGQPVSTAHLPKQVKDDYFSRLTAETPYKADIEQLITVGPGHQKTLMEAGQEVADIAGTEMKLAPDPYHKDPDGARKKLVRNEYDHAGQLTDYVRITLLANDAKQGQQVVDELSQRFGVVDEGWFKNPAHYMDRKLIVRFEDGTLGEVQVMSPQMYEAKELKGGWAMYSESRELPKGSPRRLELEEQMRVLYDSALVSMDDSFEAALSTDSPALASLRPKTSVKSSGDSGRADQRTSSGSTSAQPDDLSTTARVSDSETTAARDSQSNNDTGIDGSPTSGSSVDAPTSKVYPRETESQAKPGDALEPKRTEQPSDGVFINWSRIGSADDVKSLIQNIADINKESIDAGRRGVRSHEQTQLSADQLDAWKVLEDKRAQEVETGRAQGLNAEESLAVRQLWVSSAENLKRVALEAEKNPSDSNLFAFRRMLSVHEAIQLEVIAARTETARALNAWSIPANANAELARSLETLLERSGGNEVHQLAAERIAAIARNGDAQQLDAAVSKMAKARTSDMVIEAWLNGLLSGPKTHMVNMMSNTAVIFHQISERAVASRIAREFGGEGGAVVGEAMAMTFGLVSGFKDAFRMALHTAKTGESQFGLTKVDLRHQDALTAENMGINPETWAGKSVDGLGKAWRIPTRALAVSDEWFKSVGYRMELHAQALRLATEEVNMGKIPADQLKGRINSIIENPPENIKLRSIDQATYQTFTNKPGALATGITKMANEFPALRVLLPFVRTPANLMTYTFERSPLAPLMGKYQADVAAGGARRDLAQTRMAMGSMVMLSVADMAMNGSISGKGPADNPSERAAEQRGGWQAYSVNIDGRWYSYQRTDPMGMTIGLVADMVDILKSENHGPGREKDIGEIMVAAAISIGNNVTSKTYLQGLSQFFSAMSNPTRMAEGYSEQLAGSLVPTLSSEVRRAQDPYMREVVGMVDALMNRIPGLSNDLPLRRDLWGRPISYESGLGTLYDAMSPIYSKLEDREPIDEEILEQGISVTMPQKLSSIDGVEFDFDKFEGAYSRFNELAGNEVIHPATGLGAKDFMNALVTGNHILSLAYDRKDGGPDGGKAEYIRKWINEYRSLARAQLRREFPKLDRFIDDQKVKRRERKIDAAFGRVGT